MASRTEDAASSAEGVVSLAAVGRSAVLLTGGTVIAQFIAFGRQLYFAAQVGASSELDALLIALAAPMALVGILTVGVRTAIVPAYAGTKRERGSAVARQLVGTVLVWMGLAGAAAAVLLWVFADTVIAVTGPGLSGTFEDAVQYLRLLAPVVLLGVVTSIFLAVTQAESMFPVMAVVIVSEPLLAFVIMVAFWGTLGLDGFVVGTLVGAMASLAVLLAATLFRRVAPSPRLVSRGIGLTDLIRHAAPLSISAVVGQVNTAFSRAIASLLLAGGVSILRFGGSLVRTPFAAIRPAYSAALYPALVQSSQVEEGAGLAATVERVLRYAIVFFVPLAGLTLAVAPVATAIAYDRGSFEADDLALTSAVVAVSAPLIVTWTIQPVLGSALNARRRGNTLLGAGVLDLAASVSLTLLFGYFLGIIGIAFAMSIVSVVVVLFQGHRLKKIEPSLSFRSVWLTLLKSTLAVLPSALAFGIPIWAGLVGPDLVHRIIVLAVVGAMGLISYYLIARRLGLSEAASIFAFGRSSLRRVVGRTPKR